MPIRTLRSEFVLIEFPEYQREPTVWNRRQKQRLIDSILRGFDIAPIYLYRREDNALECIDGRQRLNAIMSFLGENKSDEKDNEFKLWIDNEVVDSDEEDLRSLHGKAFDELPQERAESVLNYKLIVVILSGSREADDFNLQFLRLNLGTLINAGEKLHAMVGKMRDVIFDETNGLGSHPFLAKIRIPTRRFARELTAAQIVLQASHHAEHGEFTRARHFDLQRYLKAHADHRDPVVDSIIETLNALENHAAAMGLQLGNRAICVSVVLAAWDLKIRDDNDLAEEFRDFVDAFLQRLAGQVEAMKTFNPDPDYQYLVTFQRHLTQAAVEEPAVSYRHNILRKGFTKWQETHHVATDAELQVTVS